MFTPDGVLRFHRWTHASLTLLIDHLSTIPLADYGKSVPAFGFPTLREQVVHIFNCEGLWISALQKLPYADRNPTDYPSPADARKLQSEVQGRTQTYLSDLTEESLNQNAELYFSDGDKAIRTPALILHHVLTHAFHHKGQIVSICRALGYPAPDTDLNQFE